MRRLLLALPFVLWAAAAPAQGRAPLYDPISLNIGLSCQWQQRCIAEQQRAMKRALKFVRKEQPPVWRVQLCNHNAARQRFRVDWVGFNNCIRNAVLRPLPARAIVIRARAVRAPERGLGKKRVRRVTESAPPPPSASASAMAGERG
jgi:hypothetical protein